MRFLVVQLIAENPPERPACFDTQQDWGSWLVSAHEAGERVVRRVDVGRTRADRRAGRPGNRQTYFEVLPLEQIDICRDCTSLRRGQMTRDGRCTPPAVSSPPPAVFRFRPRTPGPVEPATGTEVPAQQE